MRSCPSCGSTWTEGENYCPFDGARLGNVAISELDLAGPAVDPRIGTLLDGRYRVLAKLGSGGMGFVYKAKHETLGHEVAIKILRDSEAANAEVVERFRREAETTSLIGHPGIVRVHDFFVLPGGAHAMVLELLEGADIAQRIERLGPFEVEKAIHLVLEACEALEAAHRAGVVHRDLKPENLFVTRLPNGRQRVKILDFGLAKLSELERPRTKGLKLTRTGTIFGTPKYMAPEQGMGKPVDARSDVYALACIAYEMLAGVPPFDGENYLGIVNQHVFDPPPTFRQSAPDRPVPEAIEAAILRALSKAPADRPASMEAFGYELSRASGISLPPEEGMVTTAERPYALPAPEGTRTARLTPRPGQPDSLFPPPAETFRQRVSVRPPISPDTPVPRLPSADPRDPRTGRQPGLRLDEDDRQAPLPIRRGPGFVIPVLVIGVVLVVAYLVFARS